LTTGTLTVPRSGHTATLLNTGKVLVAGGANGAADLSAELFDPQTELFTATGNMTEARSGHTATLLNVAAVANFGMVLIVGSADSTAELYDPAVGTFTATGSMIQARTSPTATLLETGSAKLGSVLIVGGNVVAGDLTAELYNPATGTFNATGSTSILRAGHTATQLLDGRVLIAGGGTETAELYDPTTGAFTPTGSMTIVRTGATATRLQDGTVLIFGADDSAADLYDAKAGMFAPVGSYGRLAYGQTASLRQDGSVLTAGGYHLGPHSPHNSVSAAALFAPESDGFTGTGSLNTSRGSHTATQLADGTVLIVGGTERHCGGYIRCGFGVTTTTLSSAELFK
jgi:WD40 repeat protein